MTGTALVIYLSGALLRRYIAPEREVAAYPPAMDEQPLDAGILDLATHRWCGTPCRHGARWALTPPFHPYHREVAVVFCHLNPTVAHGFPLGNVMLCVARTFLLAHLSARAKRQATRLSVFRPAKVVQIERNGKKSANKMQF